MTRVVDLIPAGSSEMRRLPRLVTRFPELVRLKGVKETSIPLGSLMCGMFDLKHEAGVSTFVGTRLTDEVEIALRIVDPGLGRSPLVKWRERDGFWCFNPVWAPYHQILLPKHIVF